MEMSKNKWVHWFFVYSLIIKGINGLLEVIGGILIWAVSSKQIRQIVYLLTQDELKEDPHDLIANFLMRIVGKFSFSTQIYGSIFLLSHGIIKLVLIGALFKRILWAYPIAIFIFGLFALYQMYSFFQTQSLLMIVVTVFDIFVIIITYLEYRRLRVHL